MTLNKWYCFVSLSPIEGDSRVIVVYTNFSCDNWLEFLRTTVSKYVFKTISSGYFTSCHLFENICSRDEPIFSCDIWQLFSNQIVAKYVFISIGNGDYIELLQIVHDHCWQKCTISNGDTQNCFQFLKFF